MRIAIVALSLPEGGMSHYTAQLANALADHGSVHLFAPPGPGREAILGYLDPRVPIHPTIPLNYGKVRSFREAGDLIKSYWAQFNPLNHARNACRIRAIRPDVVHFATNHQSTWLLLPWLEGIPICATIHDPSGHPGEGFRLKHWFMLRSVRQFDRVIVHAAALRTELAAQHIPIERITVIPHGDYGFLKRLATGAPEEDLILFFGRLSRYKGIEVLCRAERLLAGRLGPYKVCIAGSGPVHFSRAIGPSGRVEVLDRFLSDAEVAELFERARVVVLPYTQASQSGVLAIALAFGKPVIVTDVGGLPEAVQFGRAGLVVPAGDEARLAEAIERLWQSAELRRTLGKAGQELVETEIGWPIVARRYLEAFRQAKGLW